MLKNNEISRWVLPNGNVCFRFLERKQFEHPWIIVIFTILLISIIGIEYLVNESLYSFAPVVISWLFASLWWLTRPMRANETVIEKTVHEIMDDTVNADAETVGATVTKSRVQYDTKGTYGIVTGMCFLVLLNNGEVWEYPLSYHIEGDDGDGFYVCGKDHVVSNNSSHIYAIHPQFLRRLSARLKLSDKARLGFLLFAIVIVGGLSFLLCYWLVIKLKWWFFGVVGLYLGMNALVAYISKKVKGKVMESIRYVVNYPSALFVVLIEITKPFNTIIGTFIYVTLFTFGVPALVMASLSHVGWIEFKPESIVFVVIALGSVLSSSHKVTRWIICHSPLKNWGNHVYESYREKLALYLIHPGNVVFVIYLVYLLFLVISGFIQIQYNRFLVSEGIDTAILKAFLVYIAFSNMISKAKATEFDVTDVLNQTLMLFQQD